MVVLHCLFQIRFHFDITLSAGSSKQTFTIVFKKVSGFGIHRLALPLRAHGAFAHILQPIVYQLLLKQEAGVAGIVVVFVVVKDIKHIRVVRKILTYTGHSAQER